jgi:hypothetical protein
MEEFDLAKSFDEVLKPTDPPKGAALKNTTEVPNGAPLTNRTEAPNPISLESILQCLPPEGQAWLNGLNRFCRRAVEHDLRTAGPNLFVEYWKSLRDTLQSSNATLVHPIAGSNLWIATNNAKLPELLR